ncbi:hypothetical protein ACFFU9_10495 [Mariniflexile ostreae]|uniref:Uncharacterized protein n=1 Tax=Mariniflexile ostreae TaxID=1520892 RepID=A0ABV5FCT2_9FLAO
MNIQGYSNGKKLTKTMLGNMTILEQLDYVKLYFDMHQKHYKREINDALDMYMCILCPAAVGKEDSFVLYSKEKDKRDSTNYYTKNHSIDGEYYYEKKETVLKGQANNEITRGELKPRLLMWTAKGIAKKNTCRIDASTCEFGSSAGNNESSDLDIPGGIKWLKSKSISSSFEDRSKYKVLYDQDANRVSLEGEDTMDCSETVCRYLQKIEWSEEVLNLNTSELYNFAKKNSNWLVIPI